MLVANNNYNMVRYEINAAAAFRCPYIMRIYEVIDEYKKVSLVCELCEGTPLNHILKKLPNGRLTEDAAKCTMY